MTFLCPSCSRPDLNIIRRIELPPDDQWDEIAVQELACSASGCGFKGIAVYEESRRGALDSECVVHTGYAMSPPGSAPDIQRAAELIHSRDRAGFAGLTAKSFPLVLAR